MVMTKDDVRSALVEAGWPSNVVDQALCIVEHESGFDNWAVGDRNLAPDAGPSYGLFQIDAAYHTDFDLRTWWDPVANARYARKLWEWNGQKFTRVWSTAGQCP